MGVGDGQGGERGTGKREKKIKGLTGRKAHGNLPKV